MRCRGPEEPQQLIHTVADILEYKVNLRQVCYYIYNYVAVVQKMNMIIYVSGYRSLTGLSNTGEQRAVCVCVLSH